MKTRERRDILAVLAHVMAKYGKGYCFTLREHLLDHLQQFHDWSISLRTLDRDLAWCVATGYLHRKQRVYNPSPGQWRQTASMYIIDEKGWSWLARNAYRYGVLFQKSLATLKHIFGDVSSLLKRSFARFRSTKSSSHQDSPKRGRDINPDNPLLKYKKPPPNNPNEGYYPAWKAPEWMLEAKTGH